MRVVKDRKMRKKKVSGTALEAFSYFFLQYRKPVLLNIQIEGFIDLLGYIFPVLFPLSDTFGQKVFDLSVDGTEVVFRPCGQGIVKLNKVEETFAEALAKVEADKAAVMENIELA